MAADDKTEKPTPKRKKEARERGQIPKSADITAWMSMLAVGTLAQISLSNGAGQMSGLLRDAGTLITKHDQRELVPYLGHAFWSATITVAPFVGGLMAIGVIIELAQAGWPPSLKRLKPQPKRMNPLTGLKRMFSPRSLWELGKAMAKVAIIFAVAWPVMRNAFFAMLQSGMSLDESLGTVTSALTTMIRNVAIAGLAIGVADYLYQRRSVMKQIRMTKQEVKEELRHQEGDQMLKSTMRSRARAMSQNRMIASAGEADVVLVNPTHYAVALRYRPERGAPEVLAKGTGFVAQRIRQQAESAGVPILSDPPLTRTIYKLCDVGRTIPTDLYEAVARILAFVLGVKTRGLLGGVLTIPGVETLLPASLAHEADRPGMRPRRRRREVVQLVTA
ncbi:MAG: EscU/YscU/HrcU family type III secretion system export apparatus switch protein [Acidimicrobiia bacterium]